MRATRGYGYGGNPGGIRLGPAGPVPDVVKSLIVANFAVYFVQAVVGRGLVWNFSLIPAAIADFELWRLLSYQFLHGGVMHLAMNSLMLWMFGSELEQRWGGRFFLRYYLLCGVAAGLTFTVARWGDAIPTVGASGAIYGVLMAYGMWFPNREVLLGFLFPIRVRYLILFLIALEFLQAVESNRTGIAHAAHLGGLVFGYAYLRWWGVSGLGVPDLPGTRDLRRRYQLWRLRRLQRKRFDDPPPPTYH